MVIMNEPENYTLDLSEFELRIIRRGLQLRSLSIKNELKELSDHEKSLLPTVVIADISEQDAILRAKATLKAERRFLFKVANRIDGMLAEKQ